MPHSPLLDKKGTMLPTPGGGVGGFDKAELYDDPGFATEQHHARPGEDDDYNMPFGEKGTEPERTKHGAAEGWLKGKEKFRKHLDEWGCHFLVAPNGDVQSSKETGATEHREMLTPVNWNKEKDGEYDWESAERDFFSQGGIEVHIGRILGKGYVEGVIRLGKFSPESVQRVNAIIDELPVKEVQVADLTSALISGEPRAVKGKLMRYVNSPAHLASRKCECHGFTESGEDKSVCTCGHQWHEHWHGGSLGCRFGKTAVGASGPSEPAFRAAQVLAQFGKIGETDVRRVAKGIDDLVSHMPVFSLSRGRPGAEAQPWAGKQAVSETPIKVVEDLEDAPPLLKSAHTDAERFREDLKEEAPGLDAYLYRSEVYCPTCGQDIIDELVDKHLVLPPAPGTDAPWATDSEHVPQPLFFMEQDESCTRCGDDIGRGRREPAELEEDRGFLGGMGISASLKGLTQQVLPSNPLLVPKEPDPETATFFKESEGDKPCCPYCGSDDYGLMPADFETAKCNKCGRNWHHGIVKGINDPKTATEKSYGTGTPIGGTDSGLPASKEDPSHPRWTPPTPPSPMMPPQQPQAEPGQAAQPSPTPQSQAKQVVNEVAQDNPQADRKALEQVVEGLQEKTGAVPVPDIDPHEAPEFLPPKPRKHLDDSLIDETGNPPIPLHKGAGTAEDEPEEEDVTDLGTVYGRPLRRSAPPDDPPPPAIDLSRRPVPKWLQEKGEPPLDLTEEDRQELRAMGIQARRKTAEDAASWWGSTPADTRRSMADRLGIDKYWTHFRWTSLPPGVQDTVRIRIQEPPLELTEEDRRHLKEMGVQAAGGKGDPLLAKKLYEEGKEAFEHGKPDEAADLLKKSLDSNPYNGPAHFMLGIALAQEGEVGGAIYELERALRIRPQDSYAYHSLIRDMEKGGLLDSLPREVSDLLRDKMVSKEAASSPGKAAPASTYGKAGQPPEDPCPPTPACPNCKGQDTHPVQDPDSDGGSLVECRGCGAFFAR